QRTAKQAEQRNALERTTLAAMAGRVDEAKKHLDEAITLGASPGDIFLWGGQIALHHGDMTQALEDLEQAARMLPQSVTAQSVLMQAYHDASQYDRFYRRFASFRDRHPETAEDYLFLGQVTGWVDPEEALRLLDKAIAMWDSALPRLVHAEVRSHYAQMTGEIEDAKLALDDIKVAQTMLGREPASLTVGLEGRLIAACTYERHKMKSRCQEELERARQDADALGQQPSLFPKALRARLTFFEYVNDSAAIAAEYSREKE